MPGALFRMVVHPEGWFAGARAMLAASVILLIGLATSAAGILVRDVALIAMGVALAVGSLASGVTLTYAAVGDRRRRPTFGAGGDDAMMALTAAMMARFDDLNARLDRHDEQHAEERKRNDDRWAEQRNFCTVHMTPLEDRLHAEQRRDQDMEARIGPFKAAFNWAVAHWPITLFVATGIGILIGWARP